MMLLSIKSSLIWISFLIILTSTTCFTIPTSNKQKIVNIRHDTNANNNKKYIISLERKISSSSSSLLRFSPIEAWDEYNILLNSDPLLVKSITAGVLLGAADISGQIFENIIKDDNDVKKDIDIIRTIRFAIFGLILQAPWNHYYYMILDEQIPPTPNEPFSITNIIKVGIDQFIQAPIFTILIFVFLGILEGKQLSTIKQQLDNDYKDTIIANWKLWIPATIINIGFVPPIFRVLYLNCVFFFWSIYLSLIVNKDQTKST